MSTQHSTRRRIATIVAAAVALLGVGTATADAQPRSQGADSRPEFVLDQDRRGEDAIRALGDRLTEVAAMNDLSPSAFRAQLREHDELWVGRTGQLLFVDGHLASGGSETESVPLAEAPLSETFLLHSRAGADRVVFLDFDGHDSTGTAWDSSTSASIAEPYSQDGDASTFNDDERATIQSIWKRVSEDFAPFDVDVTTEDPGAEAIRRSTTSDTAYGTRLVVTPTKTHDCSCGGVAYVGVFDHTGSKHDYYQPAWVFTSGVGNGAKNIAEAASHEIGHNLGLYHDDTSTRGYYSGHGDWAPIMGVGYYEPITQWSIDSYPDADNPEDDFSIMQLNGAPLTADDHGDAPGVATSLSGTTITLDALIHTASDTDAFTFTTAAGAVSLDASPAPVSPNLDISLTLLDEQGAVVAQADPASSASTGSDTSVGLGATIAATLDGGTYTLVVDGVGFGDPLVDGYTDYGSVGRYTLALSLPDGTTSTNEAPVAVAASDRTGGVAPVTVTFDGSASYDPDGDPVSYEWAVDGSRISTTAVQSWTFDQPGTYTVALSVSDGSLAGTDALTITVDAAPAPTAPTSVSASASAGTVTITWGDSTYETGYELLREYQHKNGRWQGATVIGYPTADATSFTDAPGDGTFRYAVRAVDDLGRSSSWSYSNQITVTSSSSGNDDTSDGGGGNGKGNGKGGKPAKAS